MDHNNNNNNGFVVGTMGTVEDGTSSQQEEESQEMILVSTAFPPPESDTDRDESQTFPIENSSYLGNISSATNNLSLENIVSEDDDEDLIIINQTNVPFAAPAIPTRTIATNSNSK